MNISQLGQVPSFFAMTMQEISYIEIALGMAAQVLAIAGTIVTVIIRQNNAERKRVEDIRKADEERLDALYDSIRTGDEEARKVAHEQIEKLAQHVQSVDRRVVQLEKDVAVMPTRDQLDQQFGSLRKALDDHNRSLTTRIDRMMDRTGDGSDR